MMGLHFTDSYVYARQIMERLSEPTLPSTIEKDSSSYTTLLPPVVSNTQGLDQCGWFYPQMSREQAKLFLQQLPLGFFLLRTSSLSAHRYTLSVKTNQGVVNIRIGNSNLAGITSFHLDCSKKIVDKTLETKCVIELVQQLVCTTALDAYQFTDNRGHRIPLELSKPAIKAPHSLKHMCRLTLNKQLKIDSDHHSSKAVLQKLPIPTSLKDYLQQYSCHL